MAKQVRRQAAQLGGGARGWREAYERSTYSAAHNSQFFVSSAGPALSRL